MVFKQEGQSVLPTNEAVVDSDLAATPAASTNGTVLPSKPEGANGVILYVATGGSITYTIATAAPGSAPSATITVTDTDKAVYEPLGPNTNLYITAKTGTVTYRWI